MNTVVPYGNLQPQTLQALIEEFITRDGAVHGHSDVPLDARVQAVRRQLQSGEAVIVFDEGSGSCTIVSSHPMPGRANLADDMEY